MSKLVRMAVFAALLVGGASLARAQAVNLAAGQKSWASNQDPARPVARAFDGNVNPDPSASSMAVIRPSTSGPAYVQVDLGSSRQIGTVEIYNTQEACAGGEGHCGMYSAVIVVSEDLILESDAAAPRPKVSAIQFNIGNSAGSFNSSIARVTFDRRARYVALFALGSEEFHLAELRVLEAPNGALGRSKSSQSSTLATGIASRAIDGNTGGQANRSSGVITGTVPVAQTQPQSQPWWQIDLDVVQGIRQIDVWIAGNYQFPAATLFVSEKPLTGSYSALLNNPAVAHFSLAAGTTGRKQVAVNRRGRYVKIQIGSTQSLTLALAEVQVWSIAGGAVNLRRVSQSSLSANLLATADKAVDGIADPNLLDGFGMATGVSPAGKPTPWWQIDLERIKEVRTLNLWNRSDCCGEALSDFYVFARARQGFVPTDTVATLLADPTVTAWYVPAFPVSLPMVSIPLGGQNRYFRIQKAKNQALAFAEAEFVTREGFMTSPVWGQLFDTPVEQAVANRFNRMLPTVTFAGVLPYARALDTLTLEVNDCGRGYDGHGAPCTESNGDDDTRWRELATLSSFPATPKLTAFGPEPMVPWSITLPISSDVNWQQGGVINVRAVRRSLDARVPEYPIVLGTFDAQGRPPPYLAARTPLVSTAPTPGSAAMPANEKPAFLSAGANTPVVPAGGYSFSPYYKQLDAEGLRILTLAEFKLRYGLPSNDSVAFRYYNQGDLGVRRDMTCAAQKNGDIACAVTNYGRSGEGTFGRQGTSGAGLLATVAMVYRGALPDGAPNKVAFFVYSGTADFEGEYYRIDEIQLDNLGYNKTIPGNCLTCHGGSTSGAGYSVTGAHFLPFDFTAFDPASVSRTATTEEAVRKLNAMVWDTNPGAPIRSVISGWYPGNVHTTGQTQQDSFTPDAWNTQDTDRAYYQNVLRPACRTCHLSRPESVVNMLSPSDFNKLRPLIINYVCQTHLMPNAERTADELWRGPGRAHLLQYLGLNANQCGPLLQ
jgi:hypothetical protein